jgi:hypothetical protein
MRSRRPGRCYQASPCSWLGQDSKEACWGLRATIEGFSTTTTGVIMSSYYLGFVIGSLRAPAIVAKVGHIRAFAALASVASSAVLIHAVCRVAGRVDCAAHHLGILHGGALRDCRELAQ